MSHKFSDNSSRLLYINIGGIGFLKFSWILLDMSLLSAIGVVKPLTSATVSRLKYPFCFTVIYNDI